MRHADNTARQDDPATIGMRLIDEAHMGWCCAQIQAHQALDTWLDAPARARKDRHIAYLAALDREEAAASDLARLWALADGVESHDASPMGWPIAMSCPSGS